MKTFKKHLQEFSFPNVTKEQEAKLRKQGKIMKLPKIIQLRKKKYEKIYENKIKTKVVDEYGNPLLMFHGGSWGGHGEFQGTGWFTASKVDAKYYADQFDGDVTEVFLIINNPLYAGEILHLKILLTDDILQSAKKREINYLIKKSRNSIIDFIEANDAVLIAKDIGKDGVIDLRDKKIMDAVIFSNSQIIMQ